MRADIDNKTTRKVRWDGRTHTCGHRQQDNKVRCEMSTWDGRTNERACMDNKTPHNKKVRCQIIAG